MKERRRNITWALIGALSSALVVALVFAVFNTARLASNNDSALEAIKDCTTPGRDCYERAQRQTAKAVSDINRVTVYAAACAGRRAGQTVDEIQGCVLDRLANDRAIPSAP